MTTKQLLKMAMQNVGLCFYIIWLRLQLKIINFRKNISDYICDTSLTERFADLDTTLGDTQNEDTSEDVSETTTDGEYAENKKGYKEGKATDSNEPETPPRT